MRDSQYTLANVGVKGTGASHSLPSSSGQGCSHTVGFGVTVGIGVGTLGTSPALGHTMALLWGTTGCPGYAGASSAGRGPHGREWRGHGGDAVGTQAPLPAGLASVMNGMSFLPPTDCFLKEPQRAAAAARSSQHGPQHGRHRHAAPRSPMPHAGHPRLQQRSTAGTPTPQLLHQLHGAESLSLEQQHPAPPPLNLTCACSSPLWALHVGGTP